MPYSEHPGMRIAHLVDTKSAVQAATEVYGPEAATAITHCALTVRRNPLSGVAVVGNLSATFSL